MADMTPEMQEALRSAWAEGERAGSTYERARWYWQGGNTAAMIGAGLPAERPSRPVNPYDEAAVIAEAMKRETAEHIAAAFDVPMSVVGARPVPRPMPGVDERGRSTHEHDASCAFGNPQCPAYGEPEPERPGIMARLRAWLLHS